MGLEIIVPGFGHPNQALFEHCSRKLQMQQAKDARAYADDHGLRLLPLSGRLCGDAAGLAHLVNVTKPHRRAS